MRTYSEIYNALADALTSQNWQRLKKSAVGRELLAYGTRVIMQSDTIMSRLSDAFDYTLAGSRELLSLAHTQQIPISFVKPSWVRITIIGTGVYSPFQIKYTVGNLSFYNTEYVQLEPSGVTVTLYQGVAKSMESSNSDKNIALWYNQSTPELWDNSYLTVSASDLVEAHIIGQAAPESVYVFYQSGSQVSMVSRYNKLSYGPEVNSFKLYNLYDGSLAVLDGDGEWGAIPVSDAVYQIYWLQPTAESFEDEGNLFLGNSQVADTNYLVVSSAQGDINSVAFARDYFRREYLKNNVVASFAQIRDFVNSFEFVLDSNVVAANNTVTVYIKPTVEDDSGDYDIVSAALDLYGTIFTIYEVEQAISIDFVLSISGVSPEYRTTIQEFLNEYLAYSNLPYSYKLNVGAISTLIQSKFGVTSQVTVDVSIQASSPINLPFLPTPGTIRIYSSDNLVGYDANSVIYGASNLDTFSITFNSGVSIVNDMWFIPVSAGASSPTLLTYQDTVSIGSPIAEGSSIDSIFMQQNNGYVFAKSGDFVNVFQAGQITSAAALATVVNTPVSSFKYTSVPSTFRDWFYVDSSILKFVSSGNYLLISYNNVREDGTLNEYFVLNIPVNIIVKAVYRDGSTLYVLGNERALIIKHFMSSFYSFYIANYVTAFRGIVDIDCEDYGCIGIMVEQGTDYVLYRCSSIMVDADYNIDFVKNEVIRIAKSDPALSAVNGCYVSNNYAFIVSSPNVVLASGEPDSPVILSTLTAYNCVAVGSVNYDTGYMIFSGQGNTIEYKSSASPNLPDDQYLKFSGIVWD